MSTHVCCFLRMRLDVGARLSYPLMTRRQCCGSGGSGAAGAVSEREFGSFYDYLPDRDKLRDGRVASKRNHGPVYNP
jgi:hypothetical protein